MQNYKHLLNMSDKIGILQFSKKSIPDPLSGYTTDDNARALIFAINFHDYNLAHSYANFLDKAQRDDGSWCNFYFEGQYLPFYDSEDCNGRALLASSLGMSSKNTKIRSLCRKMFFNALPQVQNQNSPRALAYTLIALCKARVATNHKKKMAQLIKNLSEELINLYKYKQTNSWLWYEDKLSYCNGIIPHSLFSTFLYNGDRKALKVARDSINFLNGILFRDNYLNIIGNKGWMERETQIPLFDQQPVDAASICLANLEAYQAITNPEYLRLANLAQEWYHGKNYHGISMVDLSSGGCYDALTSEGVNLNQGAEAVISLLISDLAIEAKKKTSIQELELEEKLS